MGSDVWSRHAAQWARVGPPLRPAPADLALLDGIVRELGARIGPVRALQLGVTPEFVGLSWPEGSDLLAVDKSPEMIAGVWPGFPRPGEGALLADWLTMELPSASRDLVLGDGIFTVLAFPHGARRLLEVVRDVLVPGGVFAFRTFLRPDAPERPEDVHAAALAGEVDSFHAYKLRLLMAVHEDVRAGVRTGDVWRAWNDGGPGVEALAAATGWPVAQIATIDAYRGQDTVYVFPSADELLRLADEAGLAVIARHVPDHALGDRCPTIVLGR